MLGDGLDGAEMDILVAQSSIDNSSYIFPYIDVLYTYYYLLS